MINKHGNEPAKIEKGLKGVILYAENKYDQEYNWIILISNVVDKPFLGERSSIIYCKAAYRIASNWFEYCVKKNDAIHWGSAFEYNFYKVTDEQKKFIINRLKENGYKYVKSLNRLIPR